MNNDQKKTHGVLTTGEILSLGYRGITEDEAIRFARVVESAVLAKAAPQSPVASHIRGPHHGLSNGANEQSPVAPADERATFEQVIEVDAADCGEGGFCDFTRDADGRYVAAGVESAWWAWQARARLADAPTVSATVPDGWRLVPVDPTPEMVEAWNKRLASTAYFTAKTDWAAMLNAAPTTPTSAADAVAAEYNEWIRYHAAGTGDFDDFLQMVNERAAIASTGAASAGGES